MPAADFAVGGLAAALRWPPRSGKFRLLAAIMIGLSAAYGIAYLAIGASRGWPAGFGDSFALWSWGRFLVDHAAAAIYDPAALRPVQLALGLDPGKSYPFGYPPSFMPVLWLLGQMPGPAAFAVLIGLSLPLYLWATLGREWRSPMLLAAVAAPSTAIGIASGQSGFLAAGLLAGGLRLAASRPIAAGVLVGLASYKPQLGLLLPIALAAAGSWRTIAAASVTAAVVAVLTSLWFGGSVWAAWIAALPGFSSQVAAESSQIRHLMPTVAAGLIRLGVGPAAAQLAQWATAAAMAAATWRLFRSGPSRLAGAGVLVAALLATPYAFVYDMPLLTTAVLWVVAERRRAGAAFGTGELLVLMLAMLAPVTLVAGATRFPFAVSVQFLLLAAVVLRHRRLGERSEPASRQPVPPLPDRRVRVSP